MSPACTVPSTSVGRPAAWISSATSPSRSRKNSLRVLALVKQIGVGVEAVVARAAGDQRADRRLQPGEERLRQHDVFKRLHGRSPPR